MKKQVFIDEANKILFLNPSNFFDKLKEVALIQIKNNDFCVQRELCISKLWDTNKETVLEILKDKTLKEVIRVELRRRNTTNTTFFAKREDIKLETMLEWRDWEHILITPLVIFERHTHEEEEK